VGDRSNDNRIRLPSVELNVNADLGTLEDSLLSVFAVIDEGDTVSVLGEIGVLVTTHFEPVHQCGS